MAESTNERKSKSENNNVNFIFEHTSMLIMPGIF